MTYSNQSVFLSFPFPEELTPDIACADYAENTLAQEIADAAKRLHELREKWLYPPELIKREPEVCSGYSDRILPVSEKAAEILRTRTLAHLYDEGPLG